MAANSANNSHDNGAGHSSGQPAANEGRGQSVMDWGGEVVSGFFNDRTVAAVAREAIKDTRDTIHQIFFGQHEHGGEIGAPLNPLASEIANDNVPHAMTGRDSLQSPSQIADQGNGQQQEGHGQGQEYQQADRNWVDYILNRGKDETPYNPDRQHIKPEDEKEQRKEEEKSKDRDDDGRGGRGGGGRC